MFYVKSIFCAGNRTVTPYRGWYNFQITKLNPNVVSKELLTIQEVATVLGENEHSLKESLTRVNVSSYFVGNMELIGIAELNRFLSQVSGKKFAKYPNSQISMM